MDSKGRVSVPERYRSLLAESGTPTVVFSQSAKPDRLCLVAWPITEWAAFLENINGMPLSHPVREYLDDIVLSTKESCTVDANGRVLVPQHLRDFAGLNGKALFVGRGRRFEVWNPERHAKIVVEHRENLSIIEQLPNYGV